MPITSRTLLELLAAPRTAATRGRIAHARQQAARDSTPAGAATRKLLDALHAQPLPERRATVEHPERRPATGLRQPALTDSDRAWLSMLTRDPAALPFEDARHLAGLARATKPGTPDRRLIDAYWKPVKAHYDRLEAQADLDNAKRPGSAIPPQAANALAELIRNETPGIGEDAALTEAQARIDNVQMGTALHAYAAEDEAARRLDTLAG